MITTTHWLNVPARAFLQKVSVMTERQAHQLQFTFKDALEAIQQLETELTRVQRELEEYKRGGYAKAAPSRTIPTAEGR